MNIYTHRTETLNASDHIHESLMSEGNKSYLGSDGSYDYFDVNGIVWSVWQPGTGNFPECTEIKTSEFDI